MSPGEQRLILIEQTSTDEEIVLWQERLKATYIKGYYVVKYYSGGDRVRSQQAASCEPHKTAKISGVRGNCF